LNDLEKSEPEEEVAYDYQEGDSEDLGSLKDFIVDDEDDVDYLSDSRSHEDDEGPAKSSDRRNSRSPALRDCLFRDDSDIEEVPIRTRTIKQDSSSDGDTTSVLSPPESDEEQMEAGYSDKKPDRMKKSGTILDEYMDSSDDADTSDDETDGVVATALGNLDLRQNRAIASGRTKIAKTPKTPKWAIERVRIAQEVFDDLDNRVFESHLGPSGAGAKVIWNKRLLTTAGTAQRKK
jgi:hypothetical protein